MNNNESSSLVCSNVIYLCDLIVIYKVLISFINFAVFWIMCLQVKKKVVEWMFSIRGTGLYATPWLFNCILLNTKKSLWREAHKIKYKLWIKNDLACRSSPVLKQASCWLCNASKAITFLRWLKNSFSPLKMSSFEQNTIFLQIFGWLAVMENHCI